MKRKIICMGDRASLVVCDSTRLEVLAVSKDKKTAIFGDVKAGKMYSNDKEAAMKFVEEDAENGEFPAILILAAIEVSGGLEEIELDKKSVL